MDTDRKNIRFLVALDDGFAVEAVFYGRETLCVSSQVGCAMGCPFCASGALGFSRNLAPHEFDRQLQEARRRKLTPRRVTVSGVGEPLLNLAAVAAFMEDCRRERLPVSLTTCGHPLSRLREALFLPHNGLMLSLHAGTGEVHRDLLPAAPDLDALFAVLAACWPRMSRRQRRRIGINYLLLAGVNDAPVQWRALAARLQPFADATIHLLACNPVAGSPFASPPAAIFAAAQAFFRAAGLNVRRPNPWRVSPEGGCGTLVARVADDAKGQSMC